MDPVTGEILRFTEDHGVVGYDRLEALRYQASDYVRAVVFEVIEIEAEPSRGNAERGRGRVTLLAEAHDEIERLGKMVRTLNDRVFQLSTQGFREAGCKMASEMSVRLDKADARVKAQEELLEYINRWDPEAP